MHEKDQLRWFAGGDNHFKIQSTGHLSTFGGNLDDLFLTYLNTFELVLSFDVISLSKQAIGLTLCIIS